MSYVDKFKVVWLMPMRSCSRTSITLLRYSDDLVNRGHELTIPEDKLDYTLIFNIRNPLSRVVSIYWLWGLLNKNFERNFKSWLYDHESWENYYQLHLDKCVNSLPKNPEFYVRTEYYGEDTMKIEPLKNFFMELGEEYEYHVKNNRYADEFEGKTDKIRFPWYSEYDEESAEFVYKLCKGQFEMFNYNPNYWKDGTP